MASSAKSPPRPRLARERGAVVANASHYNAFARAYVGAVRAIIGPDEEAALTEAIGRWDLNAAINAVPDFTNPADVRIKDAFLRLLAVVLPTYASIVAEAANSQAKRLGWAVEYYVPPIQIEKAARKRYAKTKVAIDLGWVRRKAARLVVDISAQQRDSLRRVLTRSFREDKRAPLVVRDIKRIVGLTDREARAVENRKLKMQMSGGFSPAKIDRETEKYSAKLLELRGQRIARTEAVAAETQGNVEAWKDAQSDGIIEADAEKEWIASTDACPEICAPMDGERVGIAESFVLPDGTRVDGPPGHPHCLLEDALVSVPRVLATTKRFYEGEIVVMKTAAGLELPCTPNHPILTAQGWVPANLLREGMSLLREQSEVGVFADYKHKQRQVRIGELVELFGRARHVSSVEVKVSAPDFHGDGRGSKVAIVLSDRELLGQREADSVAGFFESLLVNRAGTGKRSLIMLRSALQQFDRFFNSPDSIVRFLSLTSAEPRVVSMVDALGVSIASAFDSTIKQNSGDDRTRNAVLFRQRFFVHAAKVFGANLFLRQLDLSAVPVNTESAFKFGIADTEIFSQLSHRHAAHVKRDRVVQVLSSSIRTHVFNLQTDLGYYFANGLATHNCMCSQVLRRGSI